MSPQAGPKEELCQKPGDEVRETVEVTIKRSLDNIELETVRRFVVLAKRFGIDAHPNWHNFYNETLIWRAEIRMRQLEAERLRKG